MFADFDFSALDDPQYKEDAVREDLVAPLLKALGYQPTGNQRMLRSQSLLHPFVMIGCQKRKINIVPDYTLFYGDQIVLVLDAKRPSEAVIKSVHVEQVFSYAIHPEIRTKSYALCNGRELVLYDIDGSGPVFQAKMTELGECWTEVLKYFSPDALLNHYHRVFQPDLGIFLKNAGLGQSDEIDVIGARITSLGRLQGGGVTATASAEMIDGMTFQGSFDMTMNVLPVILSCLPSQAATMVTNTLASLGSLVWVGGVIEITWTVRLGKEELGLHKDDPMIPLHVYVIRKVSRTASLADPLDGIAADILNLPIVLKSL